MQKVAGAGCGDEGEEEEEVRKKGIVNATSIQQAIVLILVHDFWLLFSYCCGAFFISSTDLFDMFILCLVND